MSFKGYKLKIKLHAAHFDEEDSLHNVHFHTFQLTLYLQIKTGAPEYFFEIEKKLSEALLPYQKAVLGETELFREKQGSIFSIGDTLFDMLFDKTDEMGYELVKLDIYESPVEAYSVSRKALDADVNEIGSLPYFFTDTIEFQKQESPFLEYGEKEETNTEETVSDETKSEELSVAEASAASELEKEDQIIGEPEKEDTGKKETAEKKVSRTFLIFAVIILAVLSVTVTLVVCASNNYPTGADTFCHLYRADVILQNIKNGNFYPLYDPMWYNGVEIMRYWAPFPLYLLAILEAVGGSLLNGFLLFIGLTFFVGGLGFLLLGVRYKKPVLSLFLGIAWFFLPENMRVFFLDGNLPRVVINTIMPFLIYFIMVYLEERKKKALLPIIGLFFLLGLCHIGFTMMLFVTLLLFLCFYGKQNRCFGEIKWIILAALNGLLLTGLWLMPSLHGSGVGGGASGGNQVMRSFFESLTVSLNPMNRIGGNKVLFYYGLSLLILSVFGILFGNKKVRPGFITGLIIFLCTSRSVCAFFEKMPFSSLLWMTRFVTISSAFVVVAFLTWNGLKKWVVGVLCLFLLLDCIPNYRYLYEKKADPTETAQEMIEKRGGELLLNQAKLITNQRLSVLDLSSYMAFAPYYVSGVARKVPYTFGAGWEGARTAKNIMRVNSAVEGGHYRYVFDRSLELGDDTVLFDIASLQQKGSDTYEVISAGKELGYELAKQSSTGLLFHKETESSFGVITKYQNLAIGRAAGDLAFLYPSFEEGEESLDSYSLDELVNYGTVFLSDFTYSNKEKAEKLLTDAANQGVRIVIDMNKVPVNQKTNFQEIFGVGVQEISFQYNYPTIYYEGDAYSTRGFVAGMEEWRAKYLLGLSNVTGISSISEVSLAFSGTNGNDNIIFLGYNFAYYAEISSDNEAVNLLTKILAVSPTLLPERELVPIRIEVSNNEIEIYSEFDNVNTTLANIDIFHSERGFQVKNHLVVVDKGITVIEFRYPYFWEGCLVTIVGAALLAGFLFFLRRKKEETA